MRLLLVAWFACEAAVARADVIYSNLGSGGSFDGSGYVVAFPTPYANAAKFTPAFDYTVNTLEMPFQNSSGSSWVSIREDLGGVPAPNNMEEWSFAPPALPQIVTFTSVTHPTLLAGHIYWIVSVRDSFNTLLTTWYRNNTSDLGVMAANSDGFQSSWVVQPGQILGAFRLTGQCLHPIQIASQSGDQMVGIGLTAVLNVIASTNNGASLQYVWRKGATILANGPSAGGGLISGVSTPTLTIAGVGIGDSGSYSVAITGSCSPVSSNPIALTVGCGSWSQPSISGSTPSARYLHALAYDSARGKTVLFGGGTGSISITPLGETWLWDGTAWTFATSTGPSPRYGAAMAFDSARGRIVLFGGRDAASDLADTWEWNGLSWVQRTPATAPPARRQHAMAFDSTRSRTVLFGGGAGASGTPALGDTWEWDGTTWTPRTPATAPTPRLSPAMAFDAAHGLTVLYGGYPGTGSVYSDTWQWDGAAWTSRAITGPGPIGAGGFAYDSARHRCVLFGGIKGTLQWSPDTWEWNGTSWTHEAGIGPSARYESPLAYDAAHQKMVLFGGGQGLSGALADTWLFSGLGTLAILQQPPPTLAITASQPATLSVSADGGGPVTYAWRKAGVPLVNGPAPGGGTIAGATSTTLTISPAGIADSGSYDVVISNPCGSVVSDLAALTVTGAACYPNCDGSAAPPVLNANDFQCFLNKFASQDPYANCDGSTTSPVLNANDFQCFLNAYAAGCS